MSYQEPGVRVTQQTNPRFANVSGVNLITAVCGSSPSTLTKTFAITRSAEGSTDTLPQDQVVKILSVGDLKDSDDYDTGTDYTLTVPNKISWVLNGKSPAANSIYYVKMEYTLPDTHYTPKIASGLSEIEENYGPEVDAAGNINHVSLGAKIAIESGASAVLVFPIKASSGTISENDYATAYDNYLQYLPEVYRVIPMDLSAAINLKTINHVTLMSDPDERNERVCLVGADHTSTDFASVLTSVGGYAGSLGNKRVGVIYPDKATRKLSDGKIYTLNAPFVCASLAGWKSARPAQTAYTEGQINSFIELVGVKMKRTEKNLLADKGVMILEQLAGSGSPINIRHGISTDMSNIQNKEISVVEIGDYASKYIRGGLRSYIGQHNISDDLITRLKGTTNTLIGQLKNKGVCLAGSRIAALYQDADNPDKIILKITLKVPYPCNYIEVTIYLD